MTLAPTFPIRAEHLATTVHNPWTTAWPARGTALRTMDCDINVQWQRVERQPGVYDWDEMARLAAECRRRGVVLVDTIYGTPGFYSTSRADDAYGFRGGRGLPRNLDTLREFVHTRVAKFNPRGQARLLTMIEAWNEPHGYLEPCTPLEDPAPEDWRADWSAAVQIERVVHEGAKEADRGIITLTASMLGHRHNDLVQYLQAGGGKFADAIAIHSYGHDLEYLDALLTVARATIAKAGLSKAIALTECGHQPRYSERFASMPFTKQTLEWANCMLLAAAHGCLCYVTYSQDPSRQAVDAGEVYRIGNVYDAAARMVAPFVGKRIRKGSGWTATTPRWVIGNRRVVL